MYDNLELLALDAGHLTAFNKMRDLQASWLVENPPEEKKLPEKNYQVVDGIALFSITGAMVAHRDWYTEMLELPSYPDIQDTLAEIKMDSTVKAVLVKVDTPGGSVSGISEVAAVWAELNKDKPITVFCPGALLSAGVWMTAASSNITLSETAVAGSVGVITNIRSYKEMMVKEGIDNEVISSTPSKATGNPYKDITKEDIERVDQQIETAYGLFKSQVSGVRPNVLDKALNGDCFFAKEALQLNLITGIGNYNEVLSDLIKKHSEGDSMTTKKVTQKEFEIAVKAGAAPDSMEVITVPASAEAKVPKPNAVTELEHELETTKNTLVETSAKLADAESAVAELSAEIDSNTAEIETGRQLRVIAEDRIAEMRTAFSLQPVDLSGMTAESVLAEYQSLSKQYKASFPSGGVYQTPEKDTTNAEQDFAHVGF